MLFVKLQYHLTTKGKTVPIVPVSIHSPWRTRVCLVQCNQPSRVRVTVVDPELCKPVHVSSVRTNLAAPFDKVEHWHPTTIEWTRDC